MLPIVASEPWSRCGGLFATIWKIAVPYYAISPLCLERHRYRSVPRFVILTHRRWRCVSHGWRVSAVLAGVHPFTPVQSEATNHDFLPCPCAAQNLATDASISWVVDFVLAANASAPVASWAQGAVFIDGVAAPGLRGPLRLPTEADAASQGVPLVCGATGGALCGGSAERPATGIPHRPRPMFDDDLGVLNAQDAGAKVRGVPGGGES